MYCGFELDFYLRKCHSRLFSFMRQMEKEMKGLHLGYFISAL